MLVTGFFFSIFPCPLVNNQNHVNAIGKSMRSFCLFCFVFGDGLCKDQTVHTAHSVQSDLSRISSVCLLQIQVYTMWKWTELTELSAVETD